MIIEKYAKIQVKLKRKTSILTTYLSETNKKSQILHMLFENFDI
jgi:hypothetical protein